MATALMMSHHGMRRDLARFAVALEAVARGDASRSELLKDEWKSFSDKLHGHHESEDARMFPFLKAQEPSLSDTIDRLAADHRRIDPILERGKGAFAALPRTDAASSVISELLALLDAHLQTEEAAVTPFLRGAQGFPPPATEAELAMYAEGFAWSCHGIAADVLEKVYAMLPDNLRERLPAARAAYAKHSDRVWGPLRESASRTSVPE